MNQSKGGKFMSIYNIKRFQRAITKYKEIILPLYKEKPTNIYKVIGKYWAGEYLYITKVKKYLMDEMKDLLRKSSQDVCRRELERLQRYYIYINKKDNIAVNEYLQILEYFNRVTIEVENDKLWQGKGLRTLEKYKLLKYLVIYKIVSEEAFVDIKYYKYMYPKIIRYAENILEIEKLVGQSKIVDGELKNRKEVTQILFNRIEDRIVRYGSERFLEDIIRYYIQSYNTELNKFNSNNIIRNFLYHLAIKQATKSRNISSGKNSNLSLKVFDRLARALIGLFDYRIDSNLEFIFLKDDPIDYFKRIIHHDALFKDKQYDPEGILLLLEKILKGYEDKITSSFHINSSDFITISRAIIDFSTEQIKSREEAKLKVIPEDIYNKIKVNKPNITLDKIVRYFKMMITDSEINSKFNNPLDMSSIIDDSCWLIKVKDSRRLECYIPLPSISCFGLFDKVYSLIGYPNIGIEFEELVRDLIESHLEAKVYSGKYIYKDKVFETDGILIINNNIILLECKTKPLTRKARSGEINKLIIDLSKSYLKSILQAYRCEAALRKGVLSLFTNDCGDKDILSKKVDPYITFKLPDKPSFFRLSCNPVNYGTVSEAVVIRNVLDIFLLYNYAFTNEKLDKEIQGIYKNRDELIEVLLDLKKAYKCNDKEFYKKIKMQNHLMTFSILYELITRVKDIDDFIKKLSILSHIQLGNYDTYSNMDYIFSLDNKK